MRKYQFGNWNSFSVLLLIILLNSCLQNKEVSKKIPDKKKIVLFFLESFNNDKLKVYEKRKLIIDTVISTRVATGVACIKYVYASNLVIKLNRDTTFNLIEYTDKWNNFLFVKRFGKYNLILANDTTVISL